MAWYPCSGTDCTLQGPKGKKHTIHMGWVDGKQKNKYCGTYGAAKKTKPSAEQTGDGPAAATKTRQSELSEAE